MNVNFVFSVVQILYSGIIYLFNYILQVYGFLFFIILLRFIENDIRRQRRLMASRELAIVTNWLHSRLFSPDFISSHQADYMPDYRPVYVQMV